jgi:hypothetical protein
MTSPVYVAREHGFPFGPLFLEPNSAKFGAKLRGSRGLRFARDSRNCTDNCLNAILVYMLKVNLNMKF